MIITKEFLTKKFNEFNAYYFNNEIDMVKFNFIKTRRRLGQYWDATNTIEITTYYPNITQLDVEKILIHEMCHAWQRCTNHLDTGKNWAHGYWFHYIAKRVNVASGWKYNIARMTKLSDKSKEGIKQRATKNIIILVCRNSNEPNIVRVGRVTKNAMYHMETWLGEHYEDIKAYGIAEEHAEHFNWKTAKKIFHYHTYTDADYEKRVKPYIDKYNAIMFRNKYAERKISACRCG